MNAKEKELATQYAKNAYEYDRRGDMPLRNQSIKDLVEIVGFYPNRGEWTSMFYRTPKGGWTPDKMNAVKFWAKA